jgi:hypothetical protein
MCLIPHNLLDLQMLLAILSLKKVSKKRKVSKASRGQITPKSHPQRMWVVTP